jgi:hypothetical protein
VPTAADRGILRRQGGQMTQITATDRAKQINAETANRAQSEGWTFWGTLVEDASHWAEYGITTGEELDQRLAFEDYVDTYKDVHNIKPRWARWQDHSAEEWTRMARGL